jgi:2-phospho-L-lactate guanylyltransferase (CobY/MobA/RfbA family)
VLQLPGIALDVDNPSELQQLLAHPGETRTQKLIRRWPLDTGLPATGTEGL